MKAEIIGLRSKQTEWFETVDHQSLAGRAAGSCQFQPLDPADKNLDCY